MEEPFVMHRISTECCGHLQTYRQNIEVCYQLIKPTASRSLFLGFLIATPDSVIYLILSLSLLLNFPVYFVTDYCRHIGLCPNIDGFLVHNCIGQKRKEDFQF